MNDEEDKQIEQEKEIVVEKRIDDRDLDKRSKRERNKELYKKFAHGKSVDFKKLKLQASIIIQPSNVPHDIVSTNKTAAIGHWDKNFGIIELVRQRGNFWKYTGFSVNRYCYLNVEEALFLVEKGLLVIYEIKKLNYGEEYKQENIQDEMKVKYGYKTTGRMPLKYIYDEYLTLMPLSCYLTYGKLKNLEYNVFRHGKIIRSFSGDEDVYNMIKNLNGTVEETTLLDMMVSYDIYTHHYNWAKRDHIGDYGKSPCAYVIVVNGNWTFSARLLLRLLAEAKGVPIICSAMMNTGHIMLQEFTDALISLDWTNIYARPISFEDKIEKDVDEDDDDDDDDNNNNNENNKNNKKKKIEIIEPTKEEIIENNNMLENQIEIIDEQRIISTNINNSLENIEEIITNQVMEIEDTKKLISNELHNKKVDINEDDDIPVSNRRVSLRIRNRKLI
jgi:hypothetical protein